MTAPHTTETLWMMVLGDIRTRCWLWQGSKHRQGYGYPTIHGKHVLAHRLIWEMTCGPIPDGLCLLHTCDNPVCVNPAHMFLGTQSDNIADMVAKKRQRTGHKGGRPKFTTEQVLQMRDAFEQGATLRQLSKCYGTEKPVIWRIVHRHTYKSVA